MERVIYISFTCAGHIGVRQKNGEQAKAWAKAGVEAQFVYDLCGKGALLKFANRYWTLFKYFALRREPQAKVYLRQTQCLPGMGLLASFRPFWYEVNADIERENQLLRGMRQVVGHWLRDRFIEKAQAVFFVSSEIRNRAHVLTGQAYVFPNALKSPPMLAKHTRPNRVVFVGTETMPWQGVDIALRLAPLLPEYEFHFVGAISPRAGIANARFHGELIGENYTRVMESMGFAIGTLAFHRSGLTEASPLKVRDYLQHNLPVVVAYVDSDFDDCDFLLRIDTADLAVAAAQMREFFGSWRMRPMIELPRQDCLYEIREARRASIISGNSQDSVDPRPS